MAHSAATRCIAFPVLLAAACGASLFAAAGQAPAAIPAKADTATGTLKAGATSVNLAFSYAASFVNFGETLYQVILTEAPVAPDSLAKELLSRGGQPLLRGGKLSGIALTIGPDGLVRNMVPFIGADLRGSKMLSSVALTSFTIVGGRVTGQAAMPIDRTGGQGWSVSASWNATIRPAAK